MRKGPRRRGLSEPLANDRGSILGKEKGRGYLSWLRPFPREGSLTAVGKNSQAYRKSMLPSPLGLPTPPILLTARSSGLS
jgi:hypothetical protein